MPATGNPILLGIGPAVPANPALLLGSAGANKPPGPGPGEVPPQPLIYGVYGRP